MFNQRIDSHVQFMYIIKIKIYYKTCIYHKD